MRSFYLNQANKNGLQVDFLGLRWLGVIITPVNRHGEPFIQDGVKVRVLTTPKMLREIADHIEVCLQMHTAGASISEIQLDTQVVEVQRD